MEMDASLKEYQAALDAQFEERKAMILSQEEKDLAVEVEAVKRQGNQKLAHEHLVNKRALSQKETEFKDKLFQEVAALVEAYKKTPEYVQVIKKQIIDAKSFAKNDDIIIYLDPADASKKHDLEEETKCTLTMSEYSFGGGMLSILIMYLLYRTELFSMVGISMAGGVMHNLGQLLTACAIMSNLSLMSYFAVLFFSGLISGILIGILAYSIEKRLPADFR